MITWCMLAKQNKFSSIKEMLTHVYANSTNLHTAGAAIGVSWVSFRRKMKELKVIARPRGGKNYFKDVKISYEDYIKYTRRELCDLYGISMCKVHYLVCKYPKKSRKITSPPAPSRKPRKSS